MRGTFRLTRILGIDIDIHVTFFLLLVFFAVLFGPKGIILLLGVFFFVTMHELSHSIVAAHFGIKVKRITLLPIGGVASMAEVPSKPYQELLISIAGPLSNILVVIVFFYPLYFLLGKETLMYPFMVMTGQVEYSQGFNVIAHIYWLNLVLAVFSMLPAFPMDGGRVLRALLQSRMTFRDATAVAVRLGHIFALMFAYLGIVHGHIILIVVAVFIYMAASSEGLQVEVTETIKNYSVKDILAADFVHIAPDTSISNVLEFMFHTHQEDYPVMDGDKLAGFVSRKEVLHGMHEKNKETAVSEIMRTDLSAVNVNAKLHKVRITMQKLKTNALPVEGAGKIVGVVTFEDINRVYMMMH